MSLFEIVGVTSTYLTYSVGFAFMTSEKEDNFTWALQMLLKLLEPNSDMPNVVVTDRDTCMMNAVANVLPDSSAILCYFHVGKNVKARIVTDCKVKQNVVVLDVIGDEHCGFRAIYSRIRGFDGRKSCYDAESTY